MTSFTEEKIYAIWLGYDQKNFTGKFKCPKCEKEYTFKEAADKEKNKVEHSCPHCGAKLK